MMKYRKFKLGLNLLRQFPLDSTRLLLHLHLHYQHTAVADAKAGVVQSMMGKREPGSVHCSLPLSSTLLPCSRMKKNLFTPRRTLSLLLTVPNPGEETLRRFVTAAT